MTLSAPSACTGADPGYTCSANVNIACTNPFPSLVATVDDIDGDGSSSAIYEWEGPNGCTYEPKSNTGVVIVRHDLDTAFTNKAQYQTYALIDTGVLP